VLELGHELAVEAAHGVPGQEPGPLRSQQVIHPAVIACMILDTAWMKLDTACMIMIRDTLNKLGCTRENKTMGCDRSIVFKFVDF
jgi:hypothetical protein